MNLAFELCGEKQRVRERGGLWGGDCGGRRAKVWLVANIFSSVSCSEGFLFFEHAIEKNKRTFSTSSSSSHRCLSKKMQKNLMQVQSDARVSVSWK